MRRFYNSITLTGIIWLVARLELAYEFIPSGWGKLFGSGSAAWVGSQAGSAVTGFLNGALSLATGAHPAVSQWYAWVIRNLMLPGATAFSYLVAIGEVLIGLALLLGLFTRVTTVLALLMTMSYFYAGTVSTLPYVLPLLFAMLLIGSYAGYIGVDGLVLAKSSRWFALPEDNVPAVGAARLWEMVIPIFIIIWEIFMLLVFIGG